MASTTDSRRGRRRRRGREEAGSRQGRRPRAFCNPSSVLMRGAAATRSHATPPVTRPRALTRAHERRFRTRSRGRAATTQVRLLARPPASRTRVRRGRERASGVAKVLRAISRCPIFASVARMCARGCCVGSAQTHILQNALLASSSMSPSAAAAGTALIRDELTSFDGGLSLPRGDAGSSLRHPPPAGFRSCDCSSLGSQSGAAGSAYPIHDLWEVNTNHGGLGRGGRIAVDSALRVHLK